MNHPTNEQWMSFCYRETSGDDHASLSQHLRSCPECSATVKRWRQTQYDLSAWNIPARRHQRPILPMALKWAAAALLLFTSFCLGRLSLPIGNIQGSVEARVRDQLRHEFSAMLRQEVTQAAGSLASAIADVKSEQLKTTRGVQAALEKMESQRASDYVSLKKDLDTLAINADAQLRTTERHLLQVANFAQPINASAQP